VCQNVLLLGLLLQALAQLAPLLWVEPLGRLLGRDPFRIFDIGLLARHGPHVPVQLHAIDEA
jgi:hypothetical protein